MLLSAAIQVSGNAALIANHDLTPSITDFTDFGPMSTTFAAAVGRVSRSYIIADTGDAGLMLLGGVKKQITITGANAGDFSLTLNSAAAIAAGAQSGFTITFTPKGTGLRKATVTILSNDPAAPKFTYNIQGTGFKTVTAANGLQVGAGKGTGLGAVSGAAITVTYTGFVPASEFESSQDPGGAPVVLSLGITSVPPGWAQGLVGIKAGETRLIVVPPALGYGTIVHGNLPLNSPLMYLVTASTVANPVALISGNAIPIAFNDKTPSAADGTFLGATVAGSTTPLSFTFKISNGGAGTVEFPLSPVVVLATKTPANFSTSDITIDPTSTFATFVVTYTPTKVGTQTAILHVRTTDPAHPDFTFTVSGTTTPFLDLTPTGIGTINYPAGGNIVAGGGTKLKIPVTVTNLGNAAVPGQTAPVLFNFYLQDTTSGVQTLISSQSTTNLRGTASGKSKLVMMNLMVPAAVLPGSYKLLVKINENAAVSETNTANDSFLSAQVTNVAAGFNNVDGFLVSSTFPALALTGVTLKGNLKVQVRNSGNLTLPAGQKFVLQVFAHADDGTDTLIGASNINLSSWAPGKSSQFTVTTSFIGGLPLGHYLLQALLTPVQALSESSTLDNHITTTSLGGTFQLTVHQ